MYKRIVSKRITKSAQLDSAWELSYLFSNSNIHFDPFNELRDDTVIGNISSRETIAKKYAKYILKKGILGHIKDYYKDSKVVKAVKKIDKYSKVDVAIKNKYRVSTGFSLSKTSIWAKLAVHDFVFWTDYKISKQNTVFGVNFNINNHYLTTSIEVGNETNSLFMYSYNW